MKKSHIKAFLGAIGTSVIMVSSPSYAAFTWQATGGQCGVDLTCNRSATINGTNIGVAVTGLQADSTTSSISTARVNVWSGLAVHASGETTSPPEHATDANGKKESLLFSFSKAVELTSITMGWIGGYNNNSDADFSLLRYTGAGSSTVTGQSYEQLTSSGSWELVGNSMYSGGYVNGSGSTANVNTAGKSSSLWLVAALNSAYWTGGTNYLGNDFFKLKSLAVNYTPPNNVPEPSTLALMSLSFVAFGVTRRRKQSTGFKV